MKFKSFLAISLLGLSLAGCVDEKFPATKDINRLTCVPPTDPNASRYFFATKDHTCVAGPTSDVNYDPNHFAYDDELYCCKKAPSCSKFYQFSVNALGEHNGTGTCTALESKAAQNAGKPVMETLDNGRTCCYHPTCEELYGNEYSTNYSSISGLDVCAYDTKELAQAAEKQPFYVLDTGETCCYEGLTAAPDGPNCESGWITVSATEKSLCKFDFDNDKLEAYDLINLATIDQDIDDDPYGDGDGDDEEPDDEESTEDFYYCKEGKIEGQFCRYVPAEYRDSRVVYQSGQACSSSQMNPGRDTLRIHVMDIGQGDSIWIQTPDNKNILVDGGDGAAFNTQSGPIITDFLLTHGFPENGVFDAVFLTHPHSDHFGGFLNLFGSSTKFGIKNYIDPMDLDTKEEVAANYKKWITSVKSKVSKENIYMPAEEKFTKGQPFPKDFFGEKVETEYIYSSKKIDKNPNVASIIFKITFGGTSMLFTGDAEAAQEAEAIKYNVQSNFLKVCHHGSSTSSSEAFLSAIWGEKIASESNKRGAFISSGRRTFSGTYIPDTQILSNLLQYLTPKQIFSTSAGDDAKRESQTYRDDNILIVIKSDGSYYSCYEGTN
ncbi:MAG: MBL fold metallo-hydrolase [Proteobacteria bacterium]|nr:MBL fold metallo-hydrolase [Pseudomonadota bacterium]